MHPFLLVFLIGAVLLGVLLIAYYRMGGKGVSIANSRQLLDEEIQAELNRHPRSNLPRRW